jgi:hypothetical protein
MGLAGMSAGHPACRPAGRHQDICIKIFALLPRDYTAYVRQESALKNCLLRQTIDAKDKAIRIWLSSDLQNGIRKSRPPLELEIEKISTIVLSPP